MAIASPNANGSRAFAADISRHGLTAEISLTGELDLADRDARDLLSLLGVAAVVTVVTAS